MPALYIMGQSLNISVRVTGTRRAIALHESYGLGVRSVANRPWRLRSRKPYAYGIETGFHRMGKLARRAGGAWYMRAAQQEMTRIAPHELARAIRTGDPRALDRAWDGIARTGLAIAQARVPKVSHALEQSIELVLRGRALL